MSASTPPEPEPPQANPFSLRVRAYAVSALVSLVVLGLLVWIWMRVYSAPPLAYPGETIIVSDAQLQQYLDAHVTPFNTGEPPIYIPTGIVVQSLEFKGPYTIQASGYIWQRYSDSNAADVDRGVVFPESDTTTLNKVYETHQGDETLVGWNFKTTLREQFDYGKYPFDRQQIWVRMWHVDFERNVYMVPDLAGYESLDPQTLPGLDPGLVLENWQVERSYLSFRLNSYNTNFGIQDYNSEVPYPELYFNVSIKRYLWSPIIARLLAPLVILLQLFTIVMIVGKDSKRLEQFGVRPGAVIFTCAAFFFAVLVAQNSLRDEIKTYGIVYLETVHILTYVLILAVAANSVLLVAQPDLWLFENDNLVVEATYWPLLLGSLLVVTLMVFAGSW